MRFSSRSARQLALAAGVLSFASLTACNKDGGDFAKTKSGIEYKIFKKDGNGYERRDISPDGDPTYKDRVGKFLLGHMKYTTGKDSVLQNTRRDVGMPVPLPLQELKQKGAARRGPVHAPARRQRRVPLPGRFAHQAQVGPAGAAVPAQGRQRGADVRSHHRKLITQEEAQAMQPELQKRAMAAQMKQRMASPEYAKQMQEQKDAQAKMMATPEVQAQLKKDDAMLQEYAKKNGLNVQKTPSGMYYQILKPGTGPKPNRRPDGERELQRHAAERQGVRLVGQSRQAD